MGRFRRQRERCALSRSEVPPDVRSSSAMTAQCGMGPYPSGVIPRNCAAGRGAPACLSVFLAASMC
jgi:hypothetical protein